LKFIRKRKRQADLQKPLTSSLVDSFGLMGDRGYRGCEYVEVCESKEQKAIRQVVEGVNSQIKLFNRVSR
jgi:glycine/serine hydroxymethyltransferase